MMSIKSAFKRMIGTQAEDGQAIVLIALFMVVMLAMVGVAIDGGGLFLLWRDAQNAADTAALQAAYDRCTTDDETTWQATGYKAADINGFDSSNDSDEIGADFSTDNTVTVQETFLGNPSVGYVHVIIQADKPSYFIQLVYRGPLRVKAEALVFCSGAIDFSDLPGMIALGGCTCGGNGDRRMQFSGAQFRVDGDVHSNCDVFANPGNSTANHGTANGTMSGVGTVGDMDKITETEPAEPGADYKPLPALLDINLYFPTGEIFEAILAEHGPDYAQYFPGDASFGGSTPLEGLIAVDGDFTIDVNFNPAGDDFGPQGLTVVARGKIDYNGLVRDGNWFYYGHNVDNPGGHEGVTVRWSRGNGSALAMYSLYDARDECNGGTPATGIQLKSNGSGDDDLDIDGIVLAPYSLVAWQGPGIRARGPIIAWGLDFSGREFHWIPEPDYLQPMAPVMNNAK